ncbi:hypothetical protein [Paenibacillus campi]|uniref:hypothetical protein n=1 Tax=Paenibacillus campi TaxID=3106031 RepID=UPI002AFFEA87|nr:hypothetical protein [Paenibacillus sp. SGZ-1009]
MNKQGQHPQLARHSRYTAKRYARPLAAAVLATVMLGTGAALPASLLNGAYAASSTNATATTGAKQAVSADTAQRSYNLFVQRLQKPSTLGLARATLVNRIKQFDPYRASIAVLQLENAYMKHMDYASNLIYKESIQDELLRNYKGNMTIQQAAATLTRKADRAALQQLGEMGYRLETSEGVFYPIIDYPAFSTFFPYINADIKDYINIMAAEVKAPTAYDAGIVIPASELLKRGLAMETFLNRYPVSNRRTAVADNYRLMKFYIFSGSDNTPLFDPQTSEIDPQFVAGYRKVLNSYSAQQIKNSQLLTNVSDLLKLVDQNGGKSTSAVEQFLKQRVGDLF